MSDLSTLAADLTAAVDAAPDLAALEAVRVSALGKQGSISLLLKSLGAMSPDERRERGPQINGLRDTVQARIAARREALEADALEAQLASERLDLTLPPPPRRRGSLHPTLRTLDEMVAIFAEMGFAVAEGPDIEDDWHNFTALNFPPKHPGAGDARHLLPQARPRRRAEGAADPHLPGAGPHHDEPRAAHPDYRTRPHLSLRQRPDPHAHVPPDGGAGDRPRHPHGPPEVDARHLHGALLRDGRGDHPLPPPHFPFTEPSAEMDVQCDRSGGQIRIGTGSDWLEVVGCGMVHPKVLTNCGLDPTEWQGFAFGFGIDRLAMLKYGMPDLRDMFASDVRWLKHYGFSPFAALPPLTTAG